MTPNQSAAFVISLLILSVDLTFNKMQNIYLEYGRIYLILYTLFFGFQSDVKEIGKLLACRPVPDEQLLDTAII